MIFSANGNYNVNREKLIETGVFSNGRDYRRTEKRSLGQVFF